MDHCQQVGNRNRIPDSLSIGEGTGERLGAAEPQSMLPYHAATCNRQPGEAKAPVSITKQVIEKLLLHSSRLTSERKAPVFDCKAPLAVIRTNK
jgi:hypothetical protein